MAGVDKKLVLGPADSQLRTFTQYITGCSEFCAYLSVKSQYSAKENSVLSLNVLSHFHSLT